MELKNAVAVCLISLFSATLVVLIARSFDSQAAAHLEPQLERIVAELQAIRKQGGIAASPGPASDTAAADDGLTVYYFHSNYRCENCRAIEQQAKEIVETDFAPELARGRITWKVLNYEKPAGEALARKFNVKAPVVVLARGADNALVRRLDDVLALVATGDKAGFAGYVREGIRAALAGAKEPAAGASEGAPAKPAEAPPVPPDLPLPTPDLPVPE